MIRPDWRTIRRRTFDAPTTALAAHGGHCPASGCGHLVLQNEPIVLVGVALVQDPRGGRHVDLSGATWVCQRPHQEVAA